MVVFVNTQVPVTRLVDAQNASPTRATNLKNKIYYFLSLLTDTNDNYRLNLKSNGFRNLCSHNLKKILGNKDFYLIRKLLLNPDNPIIEVDQSWRNAKYAGGNGFCQGYRLRHEYNTGEVVYKTLPHKLSRLIEKYDSGDEKPLPHDYGFLLDQFDEHAITIDPLGYDFVRRMGTSLLNRVENNNPYQTNLIHNLIGRWLYYLNQIDKGKIWRKVSAKNHRLNSSITNLPKLLRPFLLCNGEPLFCVDVSSSQPYILSSIMKKEFWVNTNDGYNLKTIYPELYSELVDNGMVDDSVSYSTNNIYEYYSNHTGYTTTYYSSSQIDSSSFMWCNFFDPIEMESLYRYTKSPFYLDFYSHLLNQYYTFIPSSDNKGVKDREKLKGSMMYVLFDNNRHHRTNNEQIQVFKTVYPGVERWIGLLHDKIGTSCFSYLLQRAESYLLLHIICREFHLRYPMAPLITIHDGILTTRNYH
ncbi:hypothetical protein FJZ55_02275, partial [Candidatus Woesearchaeota archaeon]|nr:hypothetical protein [Candidatus Woesearchaeota archaeon]